MDLGGEVIDMRGRSAVGTAGGVIISASILSQLCARSAGEVRCRVNYWHAVTVTRLSNGINERWSRPGRASAPPHGSHWGCSDAR